MLLSGLAGAHHLRKMTRTCVSHLHLRLYLCHPQFLVIGVAVEGVVVAVAVAGGWTSEETAAVGVGL